MTSFLLLLLLLLTGCEAGYKMKGCLDGWVEFTCKYPNSNKTYQRIAVDRQKGRSIRSDRKDEWETEDRVSQYHDTKNKKVKVVIKNLTNKDFVMYKCKFDEIQDKEEQQIVERDGCQGQFTQTAYRTAKTTITCDYPGNNYRTNGKFFCKENNVICEDISSTKSSLKSNGTFSLTETNSGFSVSISNVSSHDAGVYWCGVDKGSYRAGLRKIQLEVQNIRNFTRSPTTGQNFTYWCGYPNGTPMKKFICKGEDPSVCRPLVSTSWTNKTNGKFFLTENKQKKNLTITVREVTAEDAGTYWCGAESTDKTRSNPFFHRFSMTVVPTSTQPTFPVSSPQSGTSTSAESHGGFQFIIPVICCVAVLLLLLFLLIFILIRRFFHSKNSRKQAAAQNIREDYVYEEIQKCVQKSGSRNAASTIYDSVDFPTNPSASLHYSTINFINSSDKTEAEATVLKPGSVCEYSTVNFSQSPNDSTVNEPSRASLELLYSTVNKKK